MKIAFDAHTVGQRETGNESYAVNLLRALTAGWPDDDYEVLTPDVASLTRTLDLGTNAHSVTVWPGWSPLRITLAMPAAARLRKCDLLHTTYVAPPFSLTPTVVTVHDLSYLVYPDAFPARVRMMLSTLVPLSVRRAARVIAISEHTRNDLIRFYDIPPAKIEVTPLAPGPAFVELPDAAERALPGGVVEPYVLAVGNLEPRKNLVRLLDAFQSIIAAGFPGRLALVGKGSGGEGIRAHSRRLGIESRVVLTGFLTEDELVLLYNRAKLFVYPSLYEGFGLPPVEAMACGCPVVASNASVLPETLGDAAILVDPKDVGALARAIKSVVDSDDLAESLKVRGFRRARAFSWENTASRTRTAYEQAIASVRAPKVSV